MPSPVCRTYRRFAVLSLFLGLGCAAAHGQSTLTWKPAGGGGTGTWDTTTANWYNGTTNVPWANGSNASFGDPAGTVSIFGSVTASQVELGSPGYVIQNFFLNGTASGLTIQTNADATITSSIFGASPYNTTFTKTGGGVLSIGGSGSNFSANGPVFFGSAVIAAGEMRFLGTNANFLSVPAVLGNNAAVLLTFAGTSNVVDSLAGGGAGSGVVRPNVTSGSLTLTLNGSGNTSFGGVITDNGSATFALQKVGSGTQTLTGANTYSGATSITGGTLVLGGVNGAMTASKSITIGPQATLLLDNSVAANDNRLAATPGVALNGGTLALNGNATGGGKAQIGAVTFSGAANLTATSSGAGVSMVVSGTLTRSGNGTLNFSNGGVRASSLTNLNGIVAPWATVNGTDWATVGTDGTVSAYTGYSTSLANATSQENLRVATAGGTVTTLPQSLVRNTVNLVNTGGSAPTTLDLGANQSLLITSGGLLTSGAGGQVIQNGKLTTSGSELVVTNQAALTISSPIANSSSAVTLTKSGAGTLTLDGTNTYSGPTEVVQGTLRVSADANLGTGGAVALNGGTLQAGASFTSPKSLQGSGGTLDTAGSNVVFTGGSNTGSFTKTGAGMLTLTGAAPSATLNTGVLRLTSTAPNAATLTLNGGRLEASGNGVQGINAVGTGAEISPDAIGKAATLTLATLTITSPQVTVDFDLGSGTTDALSVTGSLNLSGSTLLFRFSDLGGTRTGVAYPLLNSPSLARYNASNFGFDPASTAAGYQGMFSVSGNVLSVTFAAVPEPGPVLWLAGAALLLAGGACRARRTSASRVGT